MSDFKKLDASIVELYRQGKLDEALLHCNQLLSQALEDPDDFGSKIKKNYARVEYNLRQVYDSLEPKVDNVESRVLNGAAKKVSNSQNDSKHVIVTKYDDTPAADTKYEVVQVEYDSVTVGDIIPNLTSVSGGAIAPFTDNKAVSRPNDTTSTSQPTVIKPQIIPLLYKAKPKLAIFCSADGAAWYPGKTSSWQQSNLIKMAEELSVKFQVDVYANPGKESLYSLPLNNPRYINLAEASGVYDVSVFWNRLDITPFDKYLRNHPSRITNDTKASRIYCYLTSDVFGTINKADVAAMISGILFLTESHRNAVVRNMPLLKAVPYITGFGISTIFNEARVASKQDTTDNLRGKRCVYTGLWDDSLNVMLEIWPYIIEHEKTTMRSLVGGKQSFPPILLEILDPGVSGMDSKKYTAFEKRIKGLKASGVSTVSSMNDKQRMTVFRRASLALYPCVNHAVVLSEPLVQAQACGCLPVTFDIGVLDMVQDNKYMIVTKDKILLVALAEYVNKVCHLLNNVSEQQRQEVTAFGKSKVGVTIGSKFLQLLE